MVPFCSANSTDISPQPERKCARQPVEADFRPGDGEAVPPYSVYGKRIRRSWGGNIPDGGYIHMAKSLNTVPITLLHTGRCAMRSGVISAERDMVLSMSSSSASMAGTP